MADEDYGSLFLHGVGVGGTLAGNRLNYNLRLQELRSAEALRQMEEKQIAQHLSMQLYQHNLMVDAQADHAKAAAAMQADMLMHPPTIQVPLSGPPEAGQGELPFVPVPNPNGMQPEDAYLKNFLPVLTKWNGVVPGIQQPVNAMAEAALVKERRRQEALAGQARPRTPEQVQGDLALAEERKMRAQLLEAQIKALREGKQGVEPELFRTIDLFEKRTGKKFTDEEVRNMVEYHTGLKARPGVEHSTKFSDYFSKQVGKAMEQAIILDETTGKYRLPRNREEARGALKKEYDSLFGPESSTPEPPTTPNAGATVPADSGWDFPMPAGGYPKDERPTSKVKGDEVVRILEGGRRAIFNSKTRTFIRYAD